MRAFECTAVIELLAGSRRTLVLVPEHTADLARLAAVAASTGATVAVEDGCVHASSGDNAVAAEINRAAMRAGITLVQIGTERSSLEETFLAITGEN